MLSSIKSPFKNKNLFAQVVFANNGKLCKALEKSEYKKGSFFICILLLEFILFFNFSSGQISCSLAVSFMV
ncbi:hypothetical protein CLOLEP_01743 [[Clostridium] leptum DSM 753]|uniref:Uncharacterized protein n=1 Tax=[Clostridium] leptum DSM 753 TaxID=428125 RepID=A7VT51_9FIRM|nr:hypothetical protein CLOLEP_01743 [[Clostridium] leptum DSM 753]